jgi:hypothetical protein
MGVLGNKEFSISCGRSDQRNLNKVPVPGKYRHKKVLIMGIVTFFKCHSLGKTVKENVFVNL